MTTDLTTPAMPDEDDLRDLRALACSIFDKLASEALTVQQTARAVRRVALGRRCRRRG